MYYLRVSAVLQMLAFCLFVIGYFLQPSLATPPSLAAPQNHHLFAWLPPYWFLGLFQELNGSMHPVLVPLAARAWASLAIVGFVTAAVYVMSYFRTLRKIVEEPDIQPSAAIGGWLPRVGNLLETAVTQFSIRSLLRSRQHRVIFAFYLGIGFAVTVLYLKTGLARRQLSGAELWGQITTPLLACSIVLLCVWVGGVRMVSAIPLDARANWLFRTMPLRGGAETLSARRRAFVVLSVGPASLCAAAVFFSIWPWKAAAAHVVVLIILGLMLVEAGLLGTQKLPFTCSYLPGRSNFHLSFLLCISLLIALIHKAADCERRILPNPVAYGIVVAALLVCWVLIRWQVRTQAGSEVQFDEIPLPAVLELGLNRGPISTPHEECAQGNN